MILCIDCHHYASSACLRPHGPRSRVHGFREPLNRLAVQERSFFLWLQGGCGPKARFFEIKTVRPTDNPIPQATPTVPA